MNGRVKYIDITKGIAILLVIFSHLLEPNSYLKTICCVINIPLFFIASGMTVKPQSIKLSILKRFKRIYVPYVLWALIFTGFTFKKLFYIFYGTNEALLKSGSNGMLWFLPCMFFASVIVAFIINLLNDKNVKQKTIITTVLIILFVIAFRFVYSFHNSVKINNTIIGIPCAFDVVFLCLSYILFGFLIRKTVDIIANKVGIVIRFFVGILCASSAVLGCLLNYNIGYPQIATGNIGNYYIYFLISVVSSFGVIILSTIKLPNFISIAFEWFGKNSMGLFITHRVFVLTIRNYYFSHHSPLILLACFIVLTLLSIISTFIISNICPYLFGQEKTKKGVK